MNGILNRGKTLRQWILAKYLRLWNTSNANFSEGNEIIYSTEVLKSNLCDCNDPYILGRGDISIIGYVTQVAFKNCVPFTTCITKIDGTIIGDAEDLELVMPMYNLLEYSLNYSDKKGSLWFYSKYEATNFNADILRIIIILNILTIWLNYRKKQFLTVMMEF